MARQLAERGGEQPEDPVPECPLELMGIWLAYLELAGRRGTSGFGPSPLTYPDLDAWGRLTGRTLAPWEVRLLGRLDDTWLAVVAEQHQPPRTP